MEVRAVRKDPPIEKIVVSLTVDEARDFVGGVKLAGPFSRNGKPLRWLFTKVADAIEEQLE